MGDHHPTSRNPRSRAHDVSRLRTRLVRTADSTDGQVRIHDYLLKLSYEGAILVNLGDFDPFSTIFGCVAACNFARMLLLNFILEGDLVGMLNELY